MGVSNFHFPASRTRPTRLKVAFGCDAEFSTGSLIETAETSKRGMSNTFWFLRRSMSTINPFTKSLPTTTILLPASSSM